MKTTLRHWEVPAITVLEPEKWIYNTKRSSETRLRLFCFPYSGAGASAFREWKAGVPADVQVCPVQPPGREVRLAEPAITRMEPLVETLGEVLSHYDDVPYAFFGHSLGGLVAFELARHLRRRGLPEPVFLFASGCRGPQVEHRDGPMFDLPEPEFREKLRELGGTPEEVLAHAELMSVIGPVIRADYEVYDTYTFTEEEQLHCPLSVFGGRDDIDVTLEDLEAWREQTLGAFRLRILPGNHLFINQSRELLLQHISADLREVGLVR